MNSTTGQNPDLHLLWPTPILTKRFAQHERVNPELLTLFYDHRRKYQGTPAPVYASRDDLTEQYSNPALHEVAKFIMDSVFEIAAQVNKPYWKNAEDIRVKITGLWFQITNDYGFHETHVHGNCSWSGVYYVRAGDCTRAGDDIGRNVPNGITRFYGPNMEHMAGGHGEYGNLYVQDAAWDSYPEDGGLVVFPSHLKHMAFPYRGKQDRVIISFHAQIHSGKPFRYGYQFT